MVYRLFLIAFLFGILSNIVSSEPVKEVKVRKQGQYYYQQDKDGTLKKNKSKFFVDSKGCLIEVDTDGTKRYHGKKICPVQTR